MRWSWRLREIALVATLCGATRAQVDWQSLGTLPFSSGAVCYDSLRDRLVVFSGQTQTWEYDGSTWTQRLPTQSPPRGGNMVYDKVRQCCVLLGGTGATWIWDGNNWTLAATTGPLPILSQVMTWNDARGTVMLLMIATSSADLWEWNGVAWSLIPTANQLAGYPLLYNAMAYDRPRNVLVVCGANNRVTMQRVQGTWEWDVQGGWRSVPAGGPTAGWRTQVFDEARGRMVVFAQTQVFECWERIGTGNWFQRSTSAVPPQLFFDPTAYDSRRGVTYLISSTGTLWRYGPTVPASFAFHGAGCSGSLGVPVLGTAAPWSLPWLGETLVADLANLPLSIGLVTMGLSDVSSGSYTLPLDLGPFGMPNCFQRSAADASFLLLGSANTARLMLQVPSQPSLSGLNFFQQGFSLDPGVNALGATVSNSVHGVVGTK
jgi:hypothetical protein